MTKTGYARADDALDLDKQIGELEAIGTNRVEFEQGKAGPGRVRLMLWSGAGATVAVTRIDAPGPSAGAIAAAISARGAKLRALD